MFIEIGLILKLFFIRCKASSCQKINKLMFVIELVSLFADFTAISLLERTVLSGSDFAYSLYGVFPGPLGQCISVTYPKRTARKNLALTT